MERLASQVCEPCILAVVGRVKAGKSTFINAFLGDNLAKVGVTETTATINYFRYGTPVDPDRPVRCHWQSGRQAVTHAFLESLQGNYIEALQRAAGIEYLEYMLPNPSLREVTLVDTPGTGSCGRRASKFTAEFLKLQRHSPAPHRKRSSWPAMQMLSSTWSVM